MDHDELTEHVSQIAQRKTCDKTGSEGIFMNKDDFEAIMRNVQRKQEDTHRLRKLVFLLLGLVMILAGVTFATSIVASEMSKESHVRGGVWVDLEGNRVSTKSGDFSLCGDGSLVGDAAHCPAGGSQLQTSGSDPSSVDSSVKIVPTKRKQASLSSSLPDSFFMALNEVAVFSDKGHSVRFEVHGFARVPVLNSRCGNIVHLYTAWNGRLTLDSTDLSFDAATEAAFASAGLSLAVGGVGGRRLAGGHSVDGFFTAVQGVQEVGWSCQNVPLPSLPDRYVQTMRIYRPCAVAGVTHTTMDMCDSEYGGVVPATAGLSREDQLAAVSKTSRVRASLSADVPLAKTLYVAVDIEVMKSDSYELQVTRMGNHPGQEKVNLFDRRTEEDVYFQVLGGLYSEGRFYCNSSGSQETTPQKRQLRGEKQGVDSKMHFDFLDIVEEGGKLYRHFRVMPAEAFLNWMGAKSASQRPRDAYYEYWDLAEDLTPHRLLNPDGSMVVFTTARPGATDAEVEARLDSLGRSTWASTMSCSGQETNFRDPHVSRVPWSAVPQMTSPYTDLDPPEIDFYAELKDQIVAANTSSGGAAATQRSGWSSGWSANFMAYAQRARDPLAMADVCVDTCAKPHAVVKRQLEEGQALCDAPGLNELVSCEVDKAAKLFAGCASTPFMSYVHFNCLASLNGTSDGRRLFEEASAETEDEEEEESGGDQYTRMLRAAALARAPPSARGQVELGRLPDGSFVLDIARLGARRRAALAEDLGVDRLESGRLLFNASYAVGAQSIPATLETPTAHGTTDSRRLKAGLKCTAPGNGPGCVLAMSHGCEGYPPASLDQCRASLAIHISVDARTPGAIAVVGKGCFPSEAFNVPKPLHAGLCVDGGISVEQGTTCGTLPFVLRGWVALELSVGLDLVVFEVTAESLRLEVGIEQVTDALICDRRRRLEDRPITMRAAYQRQLQAVNTSEDRRRLSPCAFIVKTFPSMNCRCECDTQLYAKLTRTVGPGRLWGKVTYSILTRRLKGTVGADIFVWLPVSSLWEAVAEVQLFSAETPR